MSRFERNADSMSHLKLVSGMAEPTLAAPLVASWSVWMQAQSFSERTVADRAALVTRAAALSGVEPEDMTEAHVLAFLAQRSFTDSSRQTYFNGLRAWFSWLVQSGHRADDPMAALRKPRAGRRQGRHLRTEHVIHLLKSRMHSRTRTMILLMATQGLRAFEVAKFAGSDIDPVSREVEVLGKGGVLAILPLHPMIEEEATRYGQGWWFPQWTTNRDSKADGHILGASVTSIVSAAMKRAGVPGTGHSLRHWHATELLRAGVDSRVTQQLMRHASLATTQRYMHVDDGQRRAAILSLPDLRVA